MMGLQDGRVEVCMLIFSCKNSKITTHCWTTIDRRVLDSTGKDILCSRAKEKPQKDGRRGKIMFRIKPHTHQRCSEGSNKPCAHQDPETPQRLSQNCVWVSPLEVWVSSGLLQGQGPWVQQTWVWHKSSWRRTHHRAASTYTGLGKQTPGENKQNLVCTSIQEKGVVTSQETDPDLPLSVLESLAEAWVGSGLLQGWGHRVQQCVHRAFWRRSPLSSLPPP